MRVFNISLLIIFAAVQALAARGELESGRSGFISIDCGIEEGTSYIDDDMDIKYVSDVEFIDTGKNMKISEEFQDATQNFEKLLTTVRSFPEGNNSCYTLKPEQAQGKKYLIRAFFMYGNYDSKNALPSFRLFLDVNEWVTVDITNASDILKHEIIHKPKTDYIHICLVNIGSGTPFISALEVRELGKTIYETRSNKSLILFGRFDRGSDSANDFERYRDDFYDRIWTPSTRAHWEDITAKYVNEKFSDNEYKPSASVMSTAIKPINKSSLEFYPDTNAGEKFYVYMYFLEVENPPKNQTRKFTIYLNNVPWPEDQTIVPDSYPQTIHNSYSVSGIDSLNFSINKTEDSTLPPIQNAIEYYTVKNFPESPMEQKNVDAMISIKKHYRIKKNWQGDPCIPEDFRWDGVECSKNEQGQIGIISLNLSFSGLTNQITPSFSRLGSLQSLDLSNNSLVGIIPDFFAEMPSLTTLNLSGNQLNGSVPHALVEKSNSGSLALSVDGNPDLCLPGTYKKKKTAGSPKAVIIGTVLSVSCLLVLVTMAIIFKCKRKPRDVSVAHKRDNSMKSRSKIFTYSEVVDITNNFQTVIGRGGSGVVYLGCLQDGSRVAVKTLSLSNYGSKQFQTEVQLLMRIYHRNLTSLVGYCNEGTNLVLIYEHMAYGNLQEHLSDKSSSSNILSWKERVQIALDAAQGLEYLHNGCKPPIIHRDLKSANILLNEKLQAKIADFGICRTFASESDTHISTGVAGTHGYLDPEYSTTYKLNEKSDVYSFGIVLLELITGQPVFIKDSVKIHIVAWVKKKLVRGDIREIVDPKLCGQYKINSAWKVLETAMACIPPTAVQRLNNGQVIVELKEALALELSDERGSSMQNEDGRLRREWGDIETEMAPSAR